MNSDSFAPLNASNSGRVTAEDSLSAVGGGVAGVNAQNAGGVEGTDANQQGSGEGGASESKAEGASGELLCRCILDGVLLCVILHLRCPVLI